MLKDLNTTPGIILYTQISVHRIHMTTSLKFGIKIRYRHTPC